MASYLTDFSDGIWNWTEAWHTSNSTFSVESDAAASGGSFLRHTATEANPRLLTWNDVDIDPSRADSEILARFRISSTVDNQLAFAIRASGSAGSETAYIANLRFGNFSIRKYNGSSTPQNLGSIDPSFETDVWYLVRFRVNGTSLKARIWKDGEVEPDFWFIEVTDSDISDPGSVGVSAHWDTGERDVDYFAVATNGETAAFGAGASPIRVTQSVAEAALGLPAPPFRVSQIVAEAVTQESPPLRVTQLATEVVIKEPVSAASDGLYFYQQVMEVVVKKTPRLNYYQQVLEVIKKRSQADTVAPPSGTHRTGSTQT